MKCAGEADYELARACHTNEHCGKWPNGQRASYVLGDDSDFMLFAGCRYVTFDALQLFRNKSMIGTNHHSLSHPPALPSDLGSWSVVARNVWKSDEIAGALGFEVSSEWLALDECTFVRPDGDAEFKDHAWLRDNNFDVLLARDRSGEPIYGSRLGWEKMDPEQKARFLDRCEGPHAPSAPKEARKHLLLSSSHRPWPYHHQRLVDMALLLGNDYTPAIEWWAAKCGGRNLSKMDAKANAGNPSFYWFNVDGRSPVHELAVVTRRQRLRRGSYAVRSRTTPPGSQDLGQRRGGAESTADDRRNA